MRGYHEYVRQRISGDYPISDDEYQLALLHVSCVHITYSFPHLFGWDKPDSDDLFCRNKIENVEWRKRNETSTPS